jgi:galactonate dehydratase
VPRWNPGAARLILPSVAHAGGISETKKIATMAEAYDIGVAPHCPLGPVAFAASLQIGFSTPNFVVCEMSWKVSSCPALSPISR